jgi:hypothetical protein
MLSLDFQMYSECERWLFEWFKRGAKIKKRTSEDARFLLPWLKRASNRGVNLYSKNQQQGPIKHERRFLTRLH